MALDPFGIVGVHDGFGGGADGDFLFERFVAGVGHPGHFSGESFDVRFLFFEDLLRDE